MRAASDELHGARDAAARGLHDHHRCQRRDLYGAGLQPGLPDDAVGDVLPALPDDSGVLCVALRRRHGWHAAWPRRFQLDDNHGAGTRVYCHDDLYYSNARYPDFLLGYHDYAAALSNLSA